MGILLYLYPNGYIIQPISLWIYHSTYTLRSISPDLYPDGYIALPIPLWIYHPIYTLMGISLDLYPYGYITLLMPLWMFTVSISVGILWYLDLCLHPKASNLSSVSWIWRRKPLYLYLLLSLMTAFLYLSLCIVSSISLRLHWYACVLITIRLYL
jgi:hypothetical protein